MIVKGREFLDKLRSTATPALQNGHENGEEMDVDKKEDEA